MFKICYAGSRWFLKLMPKVSKVSKQKSGVQLAESYGYMDFGNACCRISN